jgi:hypothetical protein
LICEDKFEAANADEMMAALLSANRSGIGKFKFTEFSANSSQNCSSANSGRSSSLLPAIKAAFTPPIEVPARIWSFILFFRRALNTPQPKAPSEPPPCIIRTFSMKLLSGISKLYLLCYHYIITIPYQAT